MHTSRFLLVFFLILSTLHAANKEIAHFSQQGSNTLFSSSPTGIPCVSFQDLSAAITRAKALMGQELANPIHWHNEETAFDLYKKSPAHIFCQKCIIPEKSTVAFFGDLHGNIQGFLGILGNLVQKKLMSADLILNDTVYLCFLGDYVDRGDNGAEILYLIALLTYKNPTHVLYVRGNHEDARLNCYYGFNEELERKYPGITDADIAAIQEFYDYMPAALYLGIQTKSGIDYIQCCHGGLEVGYNPQEFLAGNQSYEVIKCLDRANHCAHLPQALHSQILRSIPQSELGCLAITSPTGPVTMGFMWHDFMETDLYGNSIVAFKQGRGWVYGKALTQAILSYQSSELYSIKAIFRAHQHNGHMLTLLNANKGMVNLWNGLVYTFLPLPVASIPTPFSSYGILKVGSSYEKSSLKLKVLE